MELGRRYDEGAGVVKDHAEAAKWYRKAAEQNYAKAQYNLGICYEQGEGVAKDQAEAEMVSQSRRAELRRRAIRSGVCFGTGAGVAKDQVEAVKWVRKAAEQNQPTLNTVSVSATTRAKA